MGVLQNIWSNPDFVGRKRMPTQPGLLENYACRVIFHTTCSDSGVRPWEAHLAGARVPRDVAGRRGAALAMRRSRSLERAIATRLYLCHADTPRIRRGVPASTPSRPSCLRGYSGSTYSPRDNGARWPLPPLRAVGALRHEQRARTLGKTCVMWMRIGWDVGIVLVVLDID